MSEVSLEKYMKDNKCLSFFEMFKIKNNRKFKVLHIGNIANNGFLNSKILNKNESIDSYAVSFDYYNIMATPEWEEAVFYDKYIDQDNPELYKYNIISNKYNFASGPTEVLCKYLEYRMKNKKILSEIFEMTLDAYTKKTKSKMGRLIKFIILLKHIR